MSKPKKKKKVALNRKEIKRPAHKKPRPKKYVEARMPSLPPVPSEQIPITNDKPVETSLPDEKRLAELMKIANDALAEVAKHAQANAEHKKMLFELQHLYEKCPHIESRIDRNQLRFWFKSSQWPPGRPSPEAAIPPLGVDPNEEVCPDDVANTIKAVKKIALIPPPKKSFLSRFWSFITRK